MAPVIREAEKAFRCSVWVTAQHRQLLDEVLRFFHIVPQRDFNIMTEEQDLFYLSSAIFQKLGPVLNEEKPDCVVIQGDTTSAFVSALCAYYSKIPVAHIEAGLRTGQKFQPFPEEMNRVFIDHLADFLFAPTSRAVHNLQQEGIEGGKIFLVGNTVVDALLTTLATAYSPIPSARKGNPTCLLTLHRRENLGEPQERIFSAVVDILKEYPTALFYLSVHPNPPAKVPMKRIFSSHPRCKLIPSLPYPAFLHLMKQCDVILTDSGGIQEEAPYLKKPFLVLRDYTERMEGIEQGYGFLVGSDPEKIKKAFAEIWEGRFFLPDGKYPYGDGDASKKVVEFLRRHL